MKTSSSSNAHVHHGDSHGRVGIRLERALGRARAQLSQAVNEALSSGLEALGDRLQANWRPRGAHGGDAAHGVRLREVIERDRALIASSPVQPVQNDGAVMIAADAETSCEPAGERPSQIPLELDTPFVASATELVPRADFQCGEPIRTRTMAKLLAGQGHIARALSIYEHLLARTPGDEALRSEAALLRALES